MATHDSFLPLFLRHQREIRLFIAATIRDPHLQNDLFQETAMTLWRSYDRYDVRCPFDSWARGIARNLIRQHWRKAARNAMLLAPEAIDAVMEACEETHEEPHLMEESLRLCTEKLATHARQLLDFRYRSGLSLDEIAQRRHSTVNAVNQALVRTRLLLQRCIESQGQMMETGEVS